MSYLSALLQSSKPKVESPHQTFNLLSMFKKPNKVETPKEQKEKQEHPYIQDIKRHEVQKAKELQEKMNQSRLTAEQKLLKKQLENSKKNFIRVQNGKQLKYSKEAKSKGFAQLIDLKWGDDKKNKEKPKQKSAFNQKQRKNSIENRNNSKAQDPLRQKAKKQQYRPAQTQLPSKKHKKQSRYDDSQDEAQQLRDFISDEEMDQNQRAFKELRRSFTGKYYGKQYRERDREDIRESTFDEVAHEERVSHVIGAKQDQQQMDRERRRKLMKKKREHDSRGY